MKSDKSGKTLAIDIPADGLFLAIQHNLNGDLSKSNCEKVINRYIGKFLDAEPDIILLNVCYRRCLTPSEVFDSYLYNVETDDKGYAIKNNSGKSVKSFSSTTENVSKYFMSFILCARELLINGIDAYEIAIKRIRKTKCKVFLSVRMNDTHYFYDPAINSAFAVKDGCAHTVDKDGGNLDFSQENLWYD